MANKARGNPGGGPQGNEPVENDSVNSLMCLIWRCLRCGAAVLGTIDQKPAACQSCGGRDFEFVEED